MSWHHDSTSCYWCFRVKATVLPHSLGFSLVSYVGVGFAIRSKVALRVREWG
jgi:hypothetical protein